MRHGVIEFLVGFSKGGFETKSQMDNHTLKAVVGSLRIL